VLENVDVDEKFLGITLFALVPNTTEFLVRSIDNAMFPFMANDMAFCLVLVNNINSSSTQTESL
jgi:Ca2+/H+ antiporter